MSHARAVTVFTQLNTILRERRVSIFNINQGSIMHSTLVEGESASSLLGQLARVSRAEGINGALPTQKDRHIDRERERNIEINKQ